MAVIINPNVAGSEAPLVNLPVITAQTLGPMTKDELLAIDVTNFPSHTVRAVVKSPPEEAGEWMYCNPRWLRLVTIREP